MKTYSYQNSPSTKYKYLWTALYWLIYLGGFFIIEKLVLNYHLITLPIDYMIPFNEYFIYLYIAWFPYTAFTLLFLFFLHKQEYLRSITFLYTGMTLFLIVSVIFPNMLDLRPTIPSNTFTRTIVNMIWNIDPSVNVLPSIHVYNSIGFAIGLSRANQSLTIPSWALTIGIIISTVFVKQHGLIDILAALLLSVIMYIIVYRKDIYFFRNDFRMSRGYIR